MKFLKDRLDEFKHTDDFREKKEISNESRRRFFELTGKFGFTAATVAAGAGTLLSSEASAFTA